MGRHHVLERAAGRHFSAVPAVSITRAVALAAVLIVAATTGASAQNCRDQASFRSARNAVNRTHLRECRAGIAADFLDRQNGQRKFYKELGPHASYTQPTFVGHPWIAAREDDRCQTVVIAAPPMIVDVTRSCLTGRIGSNGRCTE